MQWKIDRDYFYRNIPKDQLEEAGYFADSSTVDRDIMATLDDMTTPIHFIRNAIGCALKPAIIVATGCFAPFHSGHLEMIVKARETLLANGFDAVFGFVSPDHDEYVQTKTHDFGADKRISIIREGIKPYDWLRVDAWAALFNKEAINFTDVVYRLQSYVNKHVGYIPVFLVAGGDNARFALTFQNEGGCVIVNRATYENRFDEYAFLVDNQRIFAAHCNDDNSSTKVRAKLAQQVDKPVNLLVRVNEENPNEFVVAKALMKYFGKVEMVSVKYQQTEFDKVTEPTISLDPLIKGTYNLALSRNYDCMGMDTLGYVARPHSEPLEAQLDKIPAGKYVLYDDDICTGRTMDFAETLLKERGIEITRRLSYVHGNEFQEVLDARDFLYGEQSCGLVMQQADGTHVRRPYILPFVNPAVRASVQNSVEFSLHMWKMNYDLSEGQTRQECAKHIDLLSL